MTSVLLLNLLTELQPLYAAGDAALTDVPLTLGAAVTTVDLTDDALGPAWDKLTAADAARPAARSRAGRTPWTRSPGAGGISTPPRALCTVTAPRRMERAGVESSAVWPGLSRGPWPPARGKSGPPDPACPGGDRSHRGTPGWPMGARSRRGPRLHQPPASVARHRPHAAGPRFRVHPPAHAPRPVKPRLDRGFGEDRVRDTDLRQRVHPIARRVCGGQRRQV